MNMLIRMKFPLDRWLLRFSLSWQIARAGVTIRSREGNSVTLDSQGTKWSCRLCEVRGRGRHQPRLEGHHESGIEYGYISAE